jgi:hypothetical protein
MLLDCPDPMLATTNTVSNKSATWLSGDNEELTSSRKRRAEGLAASSTPIVTRLRCSTLRPPSPGCPINASAIGPNSSREMTSSTYAFLCLSDMSTDCRSFAENCNASRMVAVGSWTSCCIQKPHDRENAASRGCPAICISPFTTPTSFLCESVSSNVVLPAPEAPIRAVS